MQLRNKVTGATVEAIQLVSNQKASYIPRDEDGVAIPGADPVVESYLAGDWYLGLDAETGLGIFRTAAQVASDWEPVDAP